jgi:hypothetical protein
LLMPVLPRFIVSWRKQECCKRKLMIRARDKGFKQPLKLHEHWHTDFSYVKIEHRFFFNLRVGRL